MERLNHSLAELTQRMARYLADDAPFPSAEGDTFAEVLETAVVAVVRADLCFTGAFVQAAVVRETVGGLLGRIHLGLWIRPLTREELGRLVLEAYRRLSRPDPDEYEPPPEDGPGSLTRLMLQFLTLRFLIPVHSSPSQPCLV